MKKLLIIIFSFCFLNVAFSQNKRVLDSAKFSMDSTYVIYPGNDTVYLQPQVNAGFEGAQKGWDRYLTKNVNSAVAQKNGAKPGIYPIQTLYIINKEGRVIDVELLNNPGFGIDEEVIRVLLGSPLWISAKNKGHAVQCLRSQNFSFEVLREDEPDSIMKRITLDSIIDNPEIHAEYRGGEQEWTKFITKYINPLIPIINGAPLGEYRVTATFIINRDGTISDFVVLNDPGYGTAKELLRVLKKSSKWKPAIHNGQNVKSIRKQNFKFIVDQK